MQMFTLPRFVTVDGSGAPYAGAKLEFYRAGTSTPENTYSDVDLMTPNTNPVVADSDGLFGPIFLGTSYNYKAVLKTAADVTIWTQDDIPGGALDGGKLATGSVPTAALANESVTLAKMAGGTDGNLITYDANGDPAHVATGTAGQVLKSNGAGAAPTMQDNDADGVPYDNATSGLVATDVRAAIDEVALGGTLHGPTVQTATGTETELDFTIPAWAKRITVMFGGLQRNATTATLVRLGGASGVKTSGYSAGFSRLQNNTQAAADITVGFAVGSSIDSAGAVFRGKIVIDLVGADTWCADGLIIQTDTMFNMAGTVDLGEQLTTVRITTVSGSATLAGTVSVMYE